MNSVAVVAEDVDSPSFRGMYPGERFEYLFFPGCRSVRSAEFFVVRDGGVAECCRTMPVERVDGFFETVPHPFGAHAAVGEMLVVVGEVAEVVPAEAYTVVTVTVREVCDVGGCSRAAVVECEWYADQVAVVACHPGALGGDRPQVVSWQVGVVAGQVVDVYFVSEHDERFMCAVQVCAVGEIFGELFTVPERTPDVRVETFVVGGVGGGDVDVVCCERFRLGEPALELLLFVQTPCVTDVFHARFVECWLVVAFGAVHVCDGALSDVRSILLPHVAVRSRHRSCQGPKRPPASMTRWAGVDTDAQIWPVADTGTIALFAVVCPVM